MNISLNESPPTPNVHVGTTRRILKWGFSLFESMDHCRLNYGLPEEVPVSDEDPRRHSTSCPGTRQRTSVCVYLFRTLSNLGLKILGNDSEWLYSERRRDPFTLSLHLFLRSSQWDHFPDRHVLLGSGLFVSRGGW